MTIDTIHRDNGLIYVEAKAPRSIGANLGSYDAIIFDGFTKDQHPHIAFATYYIGEERTTLPSATFDTHEEAMRYLTALAELAVAANKAN